MKELFERLVKAWPKDSEWEVTAFVPGVAMFEKRLTDISKLQFSLRSEWTDVQNAAALTIIRQELVGVGCDWSMSHGYRQDPPVSIHVHVTKGEADLSSHGLSISYNSETEAILTVAVEAFEAASKGEEPT